MRPGERRTYDEFLERLYYHYGIAIERSQLEDATIWSGLPANDYVQSGENESWLSQMLRAADLTELRMHVRLCIILWQYHELDRDDSMKYVVDTIVERILNATGVKDS